MTARRPQHRGSRHAKSMGPRQEALFDAVRGSLEKGPAYPDYEELCGRVGVSRFYLSRLFADLVALGVLRRLSRGMFELVREREARVQQSPAVAPECFIRPIPKHRLMAGRA